MSINPLKQLEKFGQSVWLDYIKRDLMSSGKLRDLINEDGLSGITSNPSIFEEAILKSNDYKQDIQKMIQKNMNINAIYEALTLEDVRNAANQFLPLYNKTQGRDGFVSIEVNPHLAHDTKGTIIEARRLWQALSCPNVFIKVPATLEGLPAITQLISEGININITLLFGLPRYRQVADAYMSGLETRLAQGKTLQGIASVASFFLSRIDVLIDPILEKYMAEKHARADLAKKMHGQVAIASAKIAYQIYQEIFNGARFKKLAEKNAAHQKLLWASTSTKNPSYSDIKYIEPLIGPETINTLPMETISNYRDHGNPKPSLEQDLDLAHWVFEKLPELDINIDKVTQQLEDEGVNKFNKAYDQLITVLGQKGD